MPECRFPERLEQMKALYERGKTLEEVATAFNLTVPAVWSNFERHGIKRRKGGSRKRK